LAAAYTEAVALRDKALPAAQRAFDVTQTGFQRGYFDFLGIHTDATFYANRQRADGQKPSDALRLAAAVHLRPIVMTATVTIFVRLPVAVNPAVGSRIFQPFAITVIGGLFSATAATLLLVPVLATLSLP
jgi:hypothetical protein